MHKRVQGGRQRLRFPLRAGITAAAALGLAAGAGAGLPAVASAATTTPASLAPALAGATRGGAVIVVLKNQHSGLGMRASATRLRTAARSDQASVVSSIRASHGTHVMQLTTPSAVAATLSAAEVSKLRSNPAVARIIPDPQVRVTSPAPASQPAVQKVAVRRSASPNACPFNPAGPSKPLQEPESDTDIHASDGNPHAPDMANSIATGTGVVVANEGMNELAGNPNFTRADGSHVVIDAPDYTADDSNDEFYGDASSIAAQGTVNYQYSGALPNAGIPADCMFYIEGDAPGASLVDLSDTPFDSTTQSLAQVVSGIDNAVTDEHADVISESFGAQYIPGTADADFFYDVDNAAVAAGVTVVASSGDSGDSGTVLAPASDPLVIAAGAVDNFRLVAMDDGFSRYQSNNMAALSSAGTAPTNKLVDLVAPGWYGGEAACADGQGGCPPNYPTESMRGTSEAAPLIAGGAADVIQAYRDTHAGASPTPAMVKDILTSTASDIDSPADQQGAGLLNIYAAVQAARQMPGSTLGHSGTSALVATPSQLDLEGNGGTTTSQSVSLYNASRSPVVVTSSYRRIGPEFSLGKVTTENVSAPDPSLPVPEAGATAASPISLTVPPHLGRLDIDMIWPDPTNSNTLQVQLFNSRGALVQESYDDGTLPTTRRAGSIPNIQHIEVSAPAPGRYTAKILWSGKDQDLALPPIAPGPYTGPMSLRVMGQNWLTTPATRPVIIGAHASAAVPLRVAFPAAPGDSPESVQFTAAGPGGESVTSVPVSRRTLIPSSAGSFQTVITSTVGRSIGQVNTYNISVPAGAPQLTVNLQTADVSPNNKITYYLVDPAGAVVATASTPNAAAGATPGTATLTAPSPVAGKWEIDVELGLTVSGSEFTQTVNGTVSDSG
jgi:type IV pilus biogenesis protein CpaD/CtpE